jgi:uncharacterized protein GlcG (DUF336 family)
MRDRDRADGRRGAWRDAPRGGRRTRRCCGGRAPATSRRARSRAADWGWNTTDDRVVVYAGGIPLIVDGLLVGGLGASSGAADEDEACVVAAAQTLGFS